MSVSGLFFILFITFHASMNAVVIFSDEAYNAVCSFLGTNWYAIAGTAVVALGFLVHLVYAFILTIQNRKARGTDKYDSVTRPASVEWASKNMLVLGIIILVGLILHLYMFWSKMMFAELAGIENAEGIVGSDGAGFVHYWFSNIWVVVVYIIWLVALWFHITHGFWSAFQTIGWNNKIWMPRLKCLADIFATVVCGVFAAVVIVAYCQSLL